MLKYRKIGFIIILVLAWCLLSACTKRLGENSKIGSGGGASSSSQGQTDTNTNNSTEDTPPVDTEPTKIEEPEVTVTPEVKEDDASSSMAKDITIRVYGLTVYVNEKQIEYSKDAIDKLLSANMKSGTILYLDDNSGDYDLTEAIRSDLKELGYDYTEIGGN